jgi:hypothetical protein
MEVDELAHRMIGRAIAVHGYLGPKLKAGIERFFP